MEQVTKDQIEQAKQLDLLTYMRMYEPHELIRKGSDYCTREHDSLIISQNGLWHWFSHGIAGKTALQYLIKVKDMEFVDAVMHLCADAPICMKTRTLSSKTGAEKKKKPFVLPIANQNNRMVIDYLKRRGIAESVTQYCIAKGLIYESGDYHNAVFVGFRGETAKYAALRGTWKHMSNPFKGEVDGSNKRYSFSIKPDKASDKLVVSESAIDMLSVATIRNDIGKVHYLSIGGAYAPKDLESSRAKLPKALVQYLTDYQEIRAVELCLDNDETGIRASVFLTNKLIEKGYDAYSNPPMRGKDYNEYLLIINNERINVIVR